MTWTELCMLGGFLRVAWYTGGVWMEMWERGNERDTQVVWNACLLREDSDANV